MAAKYWIKLYHEILEDSKMGRLPDDLWRRAIELFLMAGELDDQGKLPCTGDIAWRLRLTEEALEADLTRLEAVGIMTKTPDCWLVTNFAKRQAATETVDRVRQFRERQKKQPTPPKKDNEEVTPIDNTGYSNVTKSYIDTESDKESSPTGEGDKSPPAPKVEYTDFQRIFLARFNAKRFRNSTQYQTFCGLTEKYGEPEVSALAEWAANKGMGLGDAIPAIKSALAKPNRNGANQSGHKPTKKQLTDHRPAFERDGPPTPEQFKNMLKSINP
jgi:hypothetical protein